MTDEKKTVSRNVEKLVEEVSKLTVLELAELVASLQETLGVSAMPQAAAAAPVAVDAGAQQASSATTQTVVMTNSGAQKIAVIKALREINQNLGLKEAKDATETLPYEVVKDAKAADAQVAVEKLKAAGATVEVK